VFPSGLSVQSLASLLSPVWSRLDLVSAPLSLICRRREAKVRLSVLNAVSLLNLLNLLDFLSLVSGPLGLIFGRKEVKMLLRVIVGVLNLVAGLLIAVHFQESSRSSQEGLGKRIAAISSVAVATHLAALATWLAAWATFS